MQEYRCIECDLIGVHFCHRCDIHTCEHHCLTHLDFRVCSYCLNQTCIEMMGFPDEEVDDKCFRCRAKNEIDRLNHAYKTAASDVAHRPDRDNYRAVFEYALGIASLNSKINKSTAKF